MRFKWLRKSVLLSVSLLVLGGAYASADTLDDIKKRGTLIVGGKADYKPFGFREPDGKVVGFAVDLAEDLAKAMGVKLEIVPTTAANQIQFLEQGKTDVIIAAMNDTPERRKVVYIVEPGYYASGANVMALKRVGIKKWEDLKGKKICGVQGAFYNKAVQEQYGADLVAFKTTAETYTALKGGNCVGFVYDDGNLAMRLQEPEWQEFEMVLPSILVQPVVMAVRLGEERMHKLLTEQVIAWHKSGRIAALEKKWFGRSTEFVQETEKKYKSQ
jgi:polar amino acid transport system substrate-binding protein